MLAVLLALCVIMLPFNAMPYFQSVLREMAAEGAFYPMVGMMVAWFMLFAKGERFFAPKHPTVLILAFFLGWIAFSAVFNLPSILSSETKGRTGDEKLLFQTLLLSFVTFSAFVTYNTARYIPEFLAAVRRYSLYSFWIAGAYSLAEIGFLLGIGVGVEILDTVNPFIRSAEDLYYFGRVRSVSGEASWFAMYCSFIFPWIISYVFTERRWLPFYLVTTGYLIVLLVLTWSRTAYVITAVQLVIFTLGMGLTATKTARAGRVTAFLGILLISTLLAISFFGDTIFAERSILSIYASLTNLESISNIGRIGSQLAAYGMAAEHPLFGVGFGQYGFHMREYIPDWAMASPEVRFWVSRTEGTPWPPVHAVYARLAAELGFVGLGIWAVLWLRLLSDSYRRFRENTRDGEHDTLGLALIVSIIGVLLSGFTTDTLRFFGYWILMGLTWYYLADPADRDMPDEARSRRGEPARPVVAE